MLRGEATYTDTVFGNIATNIPSEWIAGLGVQPGDYVDVRVGSKRLVMRYARTFGEVELGEQPVFLQQEVGDAHRREQVALAQQGQLARALEQDGRCPAPCRRAMAS